MIFMKNTMQYGKNIIKLPNKYNYTKSLEQFVRNRRHKLMSSFFCPCHKQLVKYLLCYYGNSPDPQ